MHALQGQLQTQEADLAELHLKCQLAERRAADSIPFSSSPSGQAAATAAGNTSKAMQTSTRNLLLAQVCSFSFSAAKLLLSQTATLSVETVFPCCIEACLAVLPASAILYLRLGFMAGDSS